MAKAIGCTLFMGSPIPQASSACLIRRNAKRTRPCFKAKTSAVGECPDCTGSRPNTFKGNFWCTLCLQYGGPCHQIRSNQTPRRGLCGVTFAFSYSFSLLSVPRNHVLWETERSPPFSSSQPFFHHLGCTMCELDKVRIHIAEKSRLCLEAPLYAMTPVEWFMRIKVFTWEIVLRILDCFFHCHFLNESKGNYNRKMLRE